MKTAILLATMAVSLVASSCTSTTQRQKLPELEVVPRVDLTRYLGTWHEIASIPQRFQKGCAETTATYALRDDGMIDVRNQCTKNGERVEARGKARIVDESNAKLKVSFFGPFWGDYWIIDLAEDYSYAVVGEPGRDALWILSRAPSLEEEQLARIVARLEAKGYDTTRLQRTP